jgi:hypothetical protein
MADVLNDPTLVVPARELEAVFERLGCLIGARKLVLALDALKEGIRGWPHNGRSS